MSPSTKHQSNGIALAASLVLAALLTLIAPQAFAERDLFANEPGAAHSLAGDEMISASPEADEPAITATEAAVRAQQHAEGKVMNVRQFQDNDKTLYGVKVLQKNGRMKTINVDANNGNIVE